MLKIYTSYFGNLKNIPENTLPLAICGKAPDWYGGCCYKGVAPKWKFFKQWKENHDNDFYIKHFNEEVLSQFESPQELYDILEGIVNTVNTKDGTNYDSLAMICYEKPDDFCHRHLVAEYLQPVCKVTEL